MYFEALQKEVSDEAFETLDEVKDYNTNEVEGFSYTLQLDNKSILFIVHIGWNLNFVRETWSYVRCQ